MGSLEHPSGCTSSDMSRITRPTLSHPSPEYTLVSFSAECPAGQACRHYSARTLHLSGSGSILGPERQARHQTTIADQLGRTRLRTIHSQTLPPPVCDKTFYRLVWGEPQPQKMEARHDRLLSTMSTTTRNFSSCLEMPGKFGASTMGDKPHGTHHMAQTQQNMPANHNSDYT